MKRIILLEREPKKGHNCEILPVPHDFERVQSSLMRNYIVTL